MARLKGVEYVLDFGIFHFEICKSLDWLPEHGKETRMDGKNSASRAAGLSVIAGFIVGVVAFLAGLLAVFNEFNYIGAGLCFLAAGLVFGLLANALFRN